MSIWIEAAVKTKLEYLSVKDADASDSHASHKPIEPTNSVDVNNNTDWFSGGGEGLSVMLKTIMNRCYYY